MDRTILTAPIAMLSYAAVPAHAQTISGCGTATISRADANSVPKLSAQIACFTKAGAVASKAVVDRQARLKAITAPPVPAPAPTSAPAATPPPVMATPAAIATEPSFEMSVPIAFFLDEEA